MGQENSIPIKKNLFEYKTNNNNSKISKSLFEFLYVIGRGGFGKVWKVKHKKTFKQYALKEMSKLKIIDRKSVKSIRAEREFLSKLNHPFLVNMIYSFQDSDNLYLVMDLFLGGDLRYHICHKKHFDEIQSKFFCACVISGLEYIHKNNIIHRDIKPENLVLDEKGYLAITDFGIAKTNKLDNSSETSGTPGYMAPEVLCAQNHSFPVDFFAIGVMCYEFLKGHRPYLGRNRQEIKEAVLARQAHVHRKDLFENGWSLEGGNFINKLLYRKPYKRLGYEGIAEIKECSWFKNFNWDELLKKNIVSPYIPKYGDNFDKKYCEAKESIDKETMERYHIYRNKESFKNIFLNYTFVRDEVQDKEKNLNQNYITSSSTKSSSGHNNFNYKFNNKNDEEKSNNENNEISDEIKNPIEINIFSIYKNGIDDINDKNNNSHTHKFKNNYYYENDNKNNKKCIYSIKKIAEYFEEPIIELDNYKNIKENNISNDNGDYVKKELNNFIKPNSNYNNNNSNNISLNDIDKNENNENNNYQIDNNTIYNLKNENNKNELINNNNNDISINNNQKHNTQQIKENKIIKKEIKQKNIIYNFDTNNNIKNNIKNNIIFVKNNKTPNNIGKSTFNIKEKNSNKNIKYNKTKLAESNNKEKKEQKQRAASLSQNRAIKKVLNKDIIKKNKNNKLFSANKIWKNETKNKFYPKQEFNSHSRSYKTNNNNDRGLISSLSNNINVQKNYNSSQMNDKKIQKNFVIINNSNISKLKNSNNCNIVYKHNIPLHSSKNNKINVNEKVIEDIQKKENNYKNVKINNQSKKVLNYIKKGNNLVGKDNINEGKIKNKNDVIENENSQINNKNINNKKQNKIYKVSSMKFLKSYNSNSNNNNDITNITNNSIKNNNKVNNVKSNKSLNNMRSQTGNILQKAKVINNIQKNKKKKNVSVKTFG